MPKTAEEIGAILDAFRTDMRTEFMRLDLLQKKIRGRYTRTWKPDGADAEYNDLQKKAFGPWLEFTRDAIAQGIKIDGYSNAELWQNAWQANGMDGKQNGITAEAVGLGKSFILVIPGSTREFAMDDAGEPTGEIVQVADTDVVIMRPLSSLHTFAYFEDAFDQYPQWVLSRLGPVRPLKFWESKWMFVDEEAVYRFDDATASPKNVRIFEHGLGYCPVARIANTIPTFGEPESSIERAIPVYQRIVDATFTLEMVQRYGAFPQKYMSGGTIAVDAAGKPLVRSSVDSLLHSTDAETKFGSFASASLSDVVVAVDAHIKHLAAVCQVPPHYLLGAVVNMSAEGIAAAESGYFRNITERQDSMSEGYELAMQIAGDILGIEVDPSTDEIHFEDTSARSLSQVADAVLKLATLDTPLARLFSMLPGVTQNDAVELAKQAAAGQEVEASRKLALAQATTPVVPPQTGETPADVVVE